MVAGPVVPFQPFARIGGQEDGQAGLIAKDPLAVLGLLPRLAVVGLGEAEFPGVGPTEIGWEMLRSLYTFMCIRYTLELSRGSVAIKLFTSSFIAERAQYEFSVAFTI